MKVVGNLQGSLVDLSPPLKDLCFTDYLQYLDFLNLNAASRIESVCELLDRRPRHGKTRLFACHDQEITENGSDVPLN